METLMLLADLLDNVPPTLIGVELSQYIDRWLYNNLTKLVSCQEILHGWLLKMASFDASDIDIGAPGSNGRVWFRVYGRKQPIADFGSYDNITMSAIILSSLTVSQKELLFMRKSVDYSMHVTSSDLSGRFRGTAYYDQGFLCCNFRRINDKLFSIDGLGIPKPISDRMNLRMEKAGLVLITGITGSGKSTTLDAIIDMNNKENEAHIVIIGHPIEYVHTSKRSLVRHREVGVDVLSFEAGAIEALRQDPDIIIVGEMRDSRTIATVLEITDSGHKALTTLHTSSAIDSIHRIIAEFPPEEQDRIRNRLADLLTVIMSQKLVPTVDGKVILSKEILSVDSSVQAAIRNKNIGEIYQMMVEGRKYGMITLEQDLLDLYKKGLISHHTAINYSNNKKRMMQLLSMK